MAKDDNPKTSPPAPSGKTPAAGSKHAVAAHSHLSSTINRIFLVLLSFGFYSCIVLLGTPDSDLVDNTSRLSLPFAGGPVTLSAFMIIGPIFIFGLTVYPHFFLSHWHSHGGSKYPSTELYLFNLPERAARATSEFLLYWLSPGLLLVFFWKDLPLPGSKYILFIAGVVSAMALWLHTRRIPLQYISKRPGVWGLLLFSLFLMAGFLGWVSRVVDLSFASLVGADLRYARLQHADASGAVFRNAVLTRANLSGAILRGAALSGARGRFVLLTGTDAPLANFDRSDFSYCFFNSSDLHDSTFFRARLRGASLRGVNLRGADLSHVDLSDAVVVSAQMRGARLDMALLYHADFRDSDLRQEQITVACLDGETRLPKDVVRPPENPEECPPYSYPDFLRVARE